MASDASKKQDGTGRAIIAFAATIHAIIVLSIAFGRPPLIQQLHNDTIHRFAAGADFYAVYHAGLNRRHGLSPYLENPDGITPYFYPYRYLPIVADLARPLTYLSPGDAYVAWIVVIETILVWLLSTLLRHTSGSRMGTFIACLLLLSSPLFLELYMGQFTFVSISLCVGSLFSRGLESTSLFTVASVLKVYPLAAIPSWLRDRARARQAMLCLAIVVIAILPYALFENEDLQSFFKANFLMDASSGYHAGNYGFTYLLYLAWRDLLSGTDTASWISFTSWFRIILLMTTSAIVLFSRTSSLRLGTAAMLLAHFLSYPHTWEHHMSAVVVLAAVLLTMPALGRNALYLVGGCAVFLALPTPYILIDVAKDPRVWDPSASWPRYASYIVLLPKALPTLGLYVVCLWALLRGGLRLAWPWRTSP